MRAVFETVDRVASSNLPVLLVGETGTGKEIVARAIHERSDRGDHPMLCVNCGAIPAELVESTLFGHERGAFTGASDRALGIFEVADGGAVLLDEVGELPTAAQCSLLRVLENRRFCRVGGTREIIVDVRVIAATHRDLDAMVARGRFRQDLLFRLNALTLTIPPLRERTDEIEELVTRFMSAANRGRIPPVTRVSAEAWTLLASYPWPGNIRELRNAVERAVVIARGDVIDVDDLPERVRQRTSNGVTMEPRGPPRNGTLGEPIDLKAAVKRYEAGLLLRALRQSGWDRRTAAELLGIPLRTLNHKIHRYELTRESA